MSTEGSVAPKERINITFKPATGGAEEQIELPLKLLVVGDFTQRPDARPIEDRAPIDIDADTFFDVMKAQNLALSMTVPNKLDPANPNGMLAVNLKFNSLDDFTPDNIVSNVPELTKLLELRGALKALKGPLGNVPDFRNKLQSLVTDPATRAKLLTELGLNK
ncbi:type VI secretion system contractile sheath small subunit [Polynucleobacter sp. IMCC30063]|uniref:type VI secretion system contractile sheath small subunit n=1 Tax=Polynucleobacter sp. IMCC30063 TaxID=2907298 RepID=UPI001F2BC244|nr:type VI secretion system contractile sheath small subunit [Polynucleobacter sp. IMCC30063]MCE7505983.1 type VI secretion system contractile sheath small subunit [Polynucleobacter sp. IMCC30063]